MLCSQPQAAGSGKSGPNWLDRLRSNKGFPIADDDLDLDHFLTNQNHPSSSLPHSNPIPNSDSSNSPSPNAIFTGILSDLFNINPISSSSSSKKFPRKQSNPKICSIPSLITDAKNLSSAARKEQNILSISSNSDNTSKAQIARAKAVKEDYMEDDKELIGYSKSEVTVIDTSCDVWKSDKLIFRRKNVWKVKDKKAKLRNYGRKKKKRKLSSQTTTNNRLPDIMIALPTNKTKLWASEQRWKKSLKPFNNIGCNPQHFSGPEVSANAPDSSDQMENVYSLSQRNGRYDPEKSDHPRA